MFIAALFVITKNQMTRCPAMNEGLNQVWYIHTGEYHSAIKRNKPLIHPGTNTTWMNFQRITLSEKKAISKGYYCIIPFILNWTNKNDKIIEIESKLEFFREGMGAEEK